MLLRNGAGYDLENNKRYMQCSAWHCCNMRQCCTCDAGIGSNKLYVLSVLELGAAQHRAKHIWKEVGRRWRCVRNVFIETFAMLEQ